MLHGDQLLARLRSQSELIQELDLTDEQKENLKQAQLYRDRLLLEGMEDGITQMQLVKAAGVSRGWLWKLKAAQRKGKRSGKS